MDPLITVLRPIVVEYNSIQPTIMSSTELPLQRCNDFNSSSYSFNKMRRRLRSTPVAYFSIDELIKGGFHSRSRNAEYSILRYVDRDRIRYKHPSTSSSSSVGKDARESLIAQLYDSECGYHFVIKTIQTRFMDDHQNFEMAASYLEHEAAMMQLLHHDNIASLRGTASEGVEAYYRAGRTRWDAYFLIVDRITESMEERIKCWRKKQSRKRIFSGRMIRWLRIGKCSREKKSIPTLTRGEEIFLSERLDVAYHIADALRYMHKRKIVYRNFGIDKVGFTFRNEVQLIELGDTEIVEENPVRQRLSAFLTSTISTKCHPKNQTSDDTTSYTAPEIQAGHALTCNANSYSFTKLLSEILTLIIIQPTSKGRQIQNYSMELRKISKQLPYGVVSLLERGANTDPRKRPSLRAFRDAIVFARRWIDQPKKQRRQASPRRSGFFALKRESQMSTISFSMMMDIDPRR